MDSSFWRSKKVIFLLLVVLLLIDFFVIGRLDILSKQEIGYGYNYPIGQNDQQLFYQRYGWSRIVYNFSNFFQFWQSPPPGKTFHNLWEFLNLDVPHSTVLFNITHFFAFAIFAILLLYVFRLPIWLVFLIGCFFNIFHEYIGEGIYTDPSFNDLWTDSLGLLVGILFYIIFLQKNNSRFLDLTQNSKIKSQNKKLKL